jgi:hypothetical protein
MPSTRGALFLSHSSDDKELTAQFGQFLRNLSLSQIDIWFSSDSDNTGGLHPGDIWFEKIRQKMESSTSIMALLTPNSILSKWVLFESGIGAAINNKKLMVVTYGVKSLADIPGPLAFWQAYRVDKEDSLREFCVKLFGSYDIQFNEILFNNYCRAFLEATKVTKIVTKTEENESPKSNADIEARLIEHFDRRFFEIASALDVRSQYLSYRIIVTNGFSGDNFEIEIRESMSIQDVLDEIYGEISSFVKAFRYLEQWILVHKKTKSKLVVREIQHQIPAHVLFKPGSLWIVEKLSAPYSPADSKPELWRERKPIG